MERISEEEVTRLGNSIGYFKVNLPNTKEKYESGNGEGIWAVVKDQGTFNKQKRPSLTTRPFVFYCILHDVVQCA